MHLDPPADNDADENVSPIQRCLSQGHFMSHDEFHPFSAIGLIVFSAFALPSHAQLTVSNTVRYQVIQRDTTAMTATYVDSGSCRGGTAKIQLQLQNQGKGGVVGTFAWKDLVDVTISGTKWKGTVPALPVGGEYTARFRALNSADTPTDSTSLIDHLLVGDVWLCSGQSNMQQDGGTKLDTSNVHTRILWNTDPGTAEAAPWGTSLTKGPTASFANRLHLLTGLPVGIIYAAKGGTSLTDWFYSRDSTGNNLFSRLSTFMDKGIAGWKIGGFLWYQGENEDQQDTWALRYMTKFVKMRDTVRLLSKNPKLPVLAVQLESWDGTSLFPLNPYSRWVRWPIIRDQQEQVGRADAWSAAAPIWPAAGLHINGTNQAALGTYAAAIATRKFYKSLATDPGAGPVFKAAWFKDSSRKDVVVQFDGVKGRLVNPTDAKHLGFYVMKPSVFDINDSTIFDYLVDSYGKPAKMLKEISSMETLDTDKVVIHLAAAATDSVTVGYGRHINLVSLSPLTDGSNVPVLTFFNRPIASSQPTSSVHGSPSRTSGRILSVVGSMLLVDASLGAGEAEISVRQVDGRVLMRRKMSGGSLDLKPLMGNGLLVITCRAAGRMEVIRTGPF